MKKFFIFLFIGVYTFLAFTPIVLAQDTQIPVGQSAVEGLDVTAQEAGLTQEGVDSPTVSQIVGLIINAILGLIGVIFLVIIITAGFKWMTAGGNEETITKSKQHLINAIIGLIIIFTAFIITNFVVFTLLGIAL